MEIPEGYIKRYCVSRRAAALGAGVYTGGASGTHTALFNLTITDVQIGLLVQDAVSSQFINGSVRGEWTMVGLQNTDNPGLVASRTFNFGTQGGVARMEKFEYHLHMSAGNVLTYTYAIFLAAVTANAINYDTYWTIGYLCPEDYLSVDMLAGNAP